MEAAAVEMEVDVEGEAELEQELGGQDGGKQGMGSLSKNASRALSWSTSCAVRRTSRTTS